MNLPMVSWGRGTFAALTGVVCVCVAHAFPPAPNYTIYGLVRDQVGATLAIDGAEIILLRDTVEIGRTPVVTDVRLDSNYELKISIDHNRSDTRTYSPKAFAPQGVYSLKVVLNNQIFFPIEANSALRVGNGGERVRLDLNLGIDANRDGLPDAWQEWVLYQAGRRSGTAGWDINLVTKNGDFTGDGVSNWIKYLAGTYHGDLTQRFELRIVGKTASAVALEFYGITGKVYGLEESADLKSWSAVAFATAPGGSTAQLLKANRVGIQPVYVATTAGTSRFYRLSVR
ncbi:MAG: hypothetical protein LW690_12410 [Opitutaceae bacterium]|jgi:hypothetical protein|nr:hypothetical protein [Opitutaceae bacterium]